MEQEYKNAATIKQSPDEIVSRIGRSMVRITKDKITLEVSGSQLNLIARAPPAQAERESA